MKIMIMIMVMIVIMRLWLWDYDYDYYPGFSEPVCTTSEAWWRHIWEGRYECGWTWNRIERFPSMLRLVAAAVRVYQRSTYDSK